MWQMVKEEWNDKMAVYMTGIGWMIDNMVKDKKSLQMGKTTQGNSKTV